MTAHMSLTYGSILKTQEQKIVGNGCILCKKYRTLINGHILRGRAFTQYQKSGKYHLYVLS